jgi:hypothetical protein
MADGREIARHRRSFDRDRTFYDLQRYIGSVAVMLPS